MGQMDTERERKREREKQMGKNTRSALLGEANKCRALKCPREGSRG